VDFIANARRQMLAGQMEDARERLLTSFDGLSGEQMVQPGACGDWSVRDLLAHVAAWDRANSEAFRMMVKGERPDLLDLEDDQIEAFNAEHHAQTVDSGLEDVVNELNASRGEMLAVLREIDNAALFAPAPGDDHADLSIASCVSVQIAHDNEHAEMIEDWRDNNDL
jgi:uncharacterized damage-inducible protein DinB